LPMAGKTRQPIGISKSGAGNSSGSGVPLARPFFSEKRNV